MKPERNVHRAAILAIMLELEEDKDGLLDGVSDIQFGKLLGCNRVTVWRYRQSLVALKQEYKRIKEALKELKRHE